MTKSKAKYILKKAKQSKKKISLKRQQEYFKPLKKVWCNTASEYTTEFSLELENILKKYQNDCTKLISTSKNIFSKQKPIEKAKKYKTHEYLDKKYNHVVVSDIKDTLDTLKESFKNQLEKAYNKYITKGSIKDSAELIFKDMDMNFNFNKFDTNTSEYLKKKSIYWCEQISDSTEKIIKRELVNGYEEGASSYDIALELKKSTGFSYERCEIIARTEIMSACNYADYVSYTQNDSIIGMEWSATVDSRTRRTHTAANGQKRKKGEAFRVGSSKLLFPCDSSLGAEAKEIINCRCTLLAIFEGEELESNTPYDEKDVGSQVWLLRQDNLFQTDYLGNDKKRILFERLLFSASDLNKPWKQIKRDIDDKMKANFKYLIDQGIFKDLPTHIIVDISKQLSEILDFGLDNNKENVCALSIDKNNSKKLFKNIKANAQNDINSDEKENKPLVLNFTDKHSKTIDEQPDNSVILIHNHPDAITFSPEDLVMLMRYKSIKYLFAVGHNGEIYLITNDNRKQYNFTEVKWQTQISIMNKMRHIKEERARANNKINTHKDIEDIHEDYIIDSCKQYDIFYYTSRR